MKCGSKKPANWAKASGHFVRAEWAFILPGGLGRSLPEEVDEGEWGGQWEFDYSRR